MTVPTVGLTPPFAFGRGWYELKRPANPPAGQALTLKVDDSTWWRINTASMTLTASATVANRTQTLDVLDQDGLLVVRWNAGFNVTASGSAGNQWQPSSAVASPGSQGPDSYGIPDVFIPTGWSLQFGAIGLQSGDQISAVALWLQHFPIGGDGYPIGAWPDARGITPPIP